MTENDEAIKELQEKAGCFVLLTNVPAEKKSALEILRTYKEQDGIEKNHETKNQGRRFNPNWPE